MDVGMAIICFAACWFFFSELQCQNKRIHTCVSATILQINIFSFKRMDVLSCTLSAVLLFLWGSSGKAWYFSDLIALCLLGTMMKLLKFRSLKQAFTFLIICLLVDSMGAIAVYLSQTMSYDVLFLNDYNEPFLIDFPSIMILYNKWCNWLPVTGTAFLGLLINFCFRFDKS